MIKVAKVANKISGMSRSMWINIGISCGIWGCLSLNKDVTMQLHGDIQYTVITKESYNHAIIQEHSIQYTLLFL